MNKNISGPTQAELDFLLAISDLNLWQLGLMDASDAAANLQRRGYTKALPVAPFTEEQEILFAKRIGCKVPDSQSLHSRRMRKEHAEYCLTRLQDSAGELFSWDEIVLLNSWANDDLS